MKLDPHIHSCYSGDAKSKPFDILRKAREIGLDIIAISDHNTIEGSKIAINESKKMDDLLVIPSIEISSSKGHILGFGVDEIIEKGLSPEETIDRIHDAGGLAIIPHPYSIYRKGLFCKINPKYLNIDAVEVLNARYIIGYSNYRAMLLANKKELAHIGSSDSHFLGSIGDCYTEIDCELSLDGVFKSIKKRKTKAKGKRTSNYLIAKEVSNKKIRKI